MQTVVVVGWLPYYRVGNFRLSGREDDLEEVFWGMEVEIFKISECGSYVRNKNKYNYN